MRLELWTEGKEASLGEILDARERRGEIQRELMKEKPASLVSFTLNIPGPVKTFPFGVWLFDVGNKLIQQAVKEEEGEIIYSLENRENTGCESFYSLTLSPEKIKRSLWEGSLTLMCWTALEEKFPGRNWDSQKESVFSAVSRLFTAAGPEDILPKKFFTGKSR